jgi:hypothetical protein
MYKKERIIFTLNSAGIRARIVCPLVDPLRYTFSFAMKDFPPLKEVQKLLRDTLKNKIRAVSTQTQKDLWDRYISFLIDFLSRPVSAKRRVARWYIFMPKIHIGVYFGGPLNGKSWHI